MVSLRHLLRVYVPCNVTGTCSEIGTSEEVWTTLMAVYLGAIFLLSLTLNGTISLVFYKKSILLSISNCFVLNLCVCQLGLTLLVLPFCLFSVVSRDYVYSGALCNFQGYLLTVFIVTIHMTLMVIALDRNYAIMNSLRYPYVFTQTRCNMMIAISWLVGIFAGIPPLVGTGQYTYQRHQFVCGLDWRSNHVYLGLFSALFFLLPVLILAFCYVKIFNAAVGHTRMSKRVHVWVSRPSSSVTTDQNDNSCESFGSGNSNDIRSYRTSGCKAVRTILVIALSYCVCWLPYFANAYLHLNVNVYNPNLNAIAICFLFATSIANPVIYAYMNRVTRREIARYLCGNAVSIDGDDFISSSVSAFASVRQSGSNWSSHHRLRPPRAFGGAMTNDMDTILEETETNIASEISVSGENVEHSCDNESLNASTLQESVQVKILSEKTDGLGARVDDNPLAKSRTKIDKRTSFGVSRLEERRRTRRAMSDASFIKHRRNDYRRKKHEYGSFLYFKHDTNNKTHDIHCSHKRKPRRQGSEQFSIDHVQHIKLATVPKAVNFRFSVTDIDSANKSMTVNSNVDIENHDANVSHPRPEEASTGHDVYLPAVPLSEEQRQFCKTRRSWSLN